MEAMTLEREWLASYLDDGGWYDEAANVRNGIDLESYETDLRLIDWLRRHTHLAQPAQAVDVGAIREVIDSLSGEANAHDEEGMPSTAAYLSRMAIKLTRALSGEKAGPVGDGWQAAFHAQREAAMRAHTICYETMLAHPDVAELGDDGRLHDAIHDILRVDGPASPTPGKEGQP